MRELDVNTHMRRSAVAQYDIESFTGISKVHREFQFSSGQNVLSWIELGPASCQTGEWTPKVKMSIDKRPLLKHKASGRKHIISLKGFGLTSGCISTFITLASGVFPAELCHMLAYLCG